MKYLVQLTLMVLAGNPPSDMHPHIDRMKTERLFPRPVPTAPVNNSNDRAIVKRSEFHMPSLYLVESHVTVNGRRGTEKSPCPQTAQAYLAGHANDILRVVVAEGNDITSSGTSSVSPVPHSIVVRHVSLPRREELDMLVTETCKLLTTLIQPLPSEVSLKALAYLEVNDPRSPIPDELLLYGFYCCIFHRW